MERQVQIKLPVDPAAAGRARAAVRELPVEPELRDMLALLVTELVGNAVRHADAPEDAHIGLEVDVAPDRVRVDVCDEGAGFTHRIRRRERPDASGGLGLELVDRLTSRWGIARADRHRVWFEVEQRVPAEWAAAARATG